MRFTIIRTLLSYMLCASFFLACGLSFLTVSALEVYVPPELEDWKNWVLEDHPSIRCPIDDVSNKRLPCVWISELAVELTSGEKDWLQFHIVGQANADGHVQLPTSEKRPVAVTLNGSPAGVGEVNDLPRVFVKRGAFSIRGRIDFENTPRTLSIPPTAAIVKLSIDGQDVSVPRIEGGDLWLQPQSTGQDTQNTLRLDVYRRLRDDIPQTLDTRIRLTVDGADRVETLGAVLFEGFKATAVDADLPVQITQDGTFLMQVSRGVSWLSVSAVSDRVGNTFTTTSTGSHWPTAETWVFLPRTQHRTVEVEGADPVDPTLVESPFGSAPTYTVPIGSTLRLANEQRGDPNPKPAVFNIAREIWLGFDGSSMVASDKIFADVQSETRIGADYQLGTVRVDGANRLVTYLGDSAESKTGITLHPSDRRIEAISELGMRSDISANGWLVDADSLNVDLNVPPGWKLLWTTGVDLVDESWLSSWWNLWDIFICVLIIVVLYRVGGIPITVVGSISILLAYQEYTAPAIGWLLLGVILLLDRQFASSTAKRLTQIVYWVVLVPVAVISIYVAATNLRQAVYPQLVSAHGSMLTRTGDSALRVDSEELRDGSLINYRRTDIPISLAERESSLRKAQSADSGVEETVVSGNFRRAVSEQSPVVAVQTGPGKPDWNWDLVRLGWAGPVSVDQRIGLVFLPPPATRVVFALVAVLHLLLMVMFALAKVGDQIDVPPRFKRVASLLLLGVATTSVSASFPDAELLNKLEERLTAHPACLPGCASLEKATLTMRDENELKIDLTILAGAKVAVPLPKSTPHTSLKEVSQDGRRQPLFHSSEGNSYIEVHDGQNHFTMSFDVREIDDLVIEFPLEAAAISTDVCCWRISKGVESDRQRVVLNRPVSDTHDVSLTSSTYEFQTPVVVERELHLQYEPVVKTTVRVNEGRTEVFTIEIPLLRGETILNDHVMVNDGNAVVVFEPHVNTVRWDSSLLLSDELVLSAPSYADRSEQWLVRGSDFWRFKGDGVTPSQSERNSTVYMPRQGETLSLKLSKPTPIPGNTLTVKHVSVTSTVGSRASNNMAYFRIESSVADSFSVELPDSSVLEGVTIDGEDQPLSTGTLVNFAITHGEHLYGVRWRMDRVLGTLYRTPYLTISSDARNVSHTVRLAKNRWILFLGGPAIGSAVLFWGVVIVTVLVGLTLTYLPRFPLTKLDAILVAIGATLANIWALLFVALWTLGIWWRARTNLDGLPLYAYRIIQLALGILAFIGLIALFFTVLSALQRPPDMYIASSSMLANLVTNTSFDAHILHWFADESSFELPTAWVFSLPFWVYQLTMLAWSLWLVFALIKWVRATFTVLSVPMYWGVSQRRQPSDEGDVEELETIEKTENNETNLEEDRPPSE